ncbi:DnaB-like helicase C-terminal domain-containing protein, partial [Staphylococcus warneri]|uniref:DnaB-like helicase C-terminal domain-containing protein n=1 Tax=Staphylococcus warneri TaxID=1292 RepID=UPI0034D980E7
MHQITPRFNPNHLIILPPPPSLRNTPFPLNIPQNVATHQHLYTLPIFSLQIPPHQLPTPIISTSPNLHSNRLTTPTITQHHSNRFTIALAKLSPTKIFIHHTPGIRI